MSTTPVLWKASEKVISESRIKKYIDFLAEAYSIDCQTYHDLWKWSVDHIDLFWQSIYDNFTVIDHGSYDSVLGKKSMPGAEWFKGSLVNYSEHIFRNKGLDTPAILYAHEGSDYYSITWSELEEKVARFRTFLVNQGVKKGDRVVAFMPTIPQTNIAFLAVNSLGAVWSSCSPDFGAESVIARFQQIEPKIFIACNGYYYNGKPYDKAETVRSIASELSSLEKLVWVPFLDETEIVLLDKEIHWKDCFLEMESLAFEPVPFDHPMWVLYSSGTTGKPKAITHSHGGCLLEHLKYMALHNDVHPGEKYFWYTTTGWMMWNFLQSSLLMGASMVLYEGSPSYPDMGYLWRMAEDLGVQHFGTSPPFLKACRDAGIKPSEFGLDRLRSVSSTGAPLTDELYDWCYSSIKSDLWLCSMSGGTDVCTAFVGGMITEPVIRGRIQSRGLGCALYAYDDQGNHIKDALGEMVIEKPMPSMPIYFWGDEDSKRYQDAYFRQYPGKWRHGDWIEIFSDGGLQIVGRSDATLNRQGIRIGTAEIYQAVSHIDLVIDSLIVHLVKEDGTETMPLFVKMKDGFELDDGIIKQIKDEIRKSLSPRHVPDAIIAVPDIPYTISGKKLEAPVKKILMGIPIDRAANRDALRNPESLDYFVGLTL